LVLDWSKCETDCVVAGQWLHEQGRVPLFPQN
jgi:hypothetical protein